MNQYRPHISVTLNRKGVLDIDAVKGCAMGMAAYPQGGCYGLCYAAKVAQGYGFDFSESISRKVAHTDNNGFHQMRLLDLPGIDGPAPVVRAVAQHPLKWFRIGTMGDPCHDWELTLELCEWLCHLRRPIIVTKHWVSIPESLLPRFRASNVIVNTSISALDRTEEITYRLAQHKRLQNAGVKSALRIVSCKFGETENGKKYSLVQEMLFRNSHVIDNPLRIPKNDPRVLCGDILVEKHTDLGGGSYISIFNPHTYIGTCGNCPEQCGDSFYN